MVSAADSVPDGFFAATSLDEKLSNADAELFFKFERCVVQLHTMAVSMT